MEGMEEKLGAILSNPEMMQKIMSIAQNFSAPQPSPEKPPQPQLPFDPALVQKVLPLLQGSSIDGNQRALLRALSPYLSEDRIARLERAMRAAKLAGLAAGFLGGGAYV